MKNSIKRIFPTLLAALVLGSAIACTGSGTPSDTDHTEALSSIQAVTDSSSLETEPNTTPPPTDFVVAEENGAASVMTPAGLVYTVTGYTAIDGGTFTFTESLNISFDEKTFETMFNRFTMTYSSDRPLKVCITYNTAEEDVFYLEAGSKDFSGLIPEFLAKEFGRDLTAIRVEPCVAGIASFSLVNLFTEQYEIPEETYFMENERFKLGIALYWGGGINYFEDKTDSDSELSNLINQHDTGRLLQQSYYGVTENEEYTPGYYGDTKWCYNPVQGGDVEGNASRIIDFVVTENSVYIKAQPRDWAVGVSIAPAYMENTYVLYDDRVQIDNRFVDFSGWIHRYASQELPAFYTVSYLDCFSLYNGTKPWIDDTLSYRDDLNFWGDAAYHNDGTFALKESNTETWCAWTNSEADFGIGIYVPNVDALLAGRFLYDGSKSALENPCNYVAPLKTIMLTSFEPLEYSYLITTGALDEIRETFKKNKDFATNEAFDRNSQSDRTTDSSIAYNEYKYGMPIQVADPISANLDLTKEINCKHVNPANNADVSFTAEQGAVTLRVLDGDPYVSISYADLLSADDYKTLKIEYMIPTTNGLPNYQCDLFFCAGDISAPTGDAYLRQSLIADGEYHILEVDLSEAAFWKGNIHMIRFDFFDGCQIGDIMYVKSMILE